MSWSHWRLWLLEKDAILWMAKGRPAKSSPSKIPTKWQHFWYSGFPNPDKWWFLWFSPQISKKTPEFSADENSWRKRRPCFVLKNRAYFSSPGKPRCSLAPPSAGPQTLGARQKNIRIFRPSNSETVRGEVGSFCCWATVTDDGWNMFGGNLMF